MTDREAIKMAFDTLVNLTSIDEYGSKEEIIAKHKTMGMLRQALAPPEREWVGLTIEEIKEMLYGLHGNDRTPMLTLVNVVQEKLKEKNT